MKDLRTIRDIMGDLQKRESGIPKKVLVSPETFQYLRKDIPAVRQGRVGTVLALTVEVSRNPRDHPYRMIYSEDDE